MVVIPRILLPADPSPVSFFSITVNQSCICLSCNNSLFNPTSKCSLYDLYGLNGGDNIPNTTVIGHLELFSLLSLPKSHAQNSKNRKQTNLTHADPYLESHRSWQRKIHRTHHRQVLGMHITGRRRTTCICVSEIFADGEVILEESGVAVWCGWRSRDV